MLSSPGDCGFESLCSASQSFSRGYALAEGFARLTRRGRRLTRDEENRAIRPFEQFRRNLTEEQLVSGPRAYPYHQQIVTTDLELAKYGFLRRADAAHRAFHLDSIRVAQPDDFADDGVGAGRRCECGAEMALP